MNTANRAADLFRHTHDASPDTVWSAPGRVNLIGEHTDYNDGFVLPFALPHRTAVAVRARADGLLTMCTLGDDGRAHSAPAVRIAELSPGDPGGWAAYPAGVAWALRRAGYSLPGADLVIVGDVPTGAGLSSSHALECAVALSLLDTVGRAPGSVDAPEPAEIARIVQHAENDFAGAPTGILDQTASLLCTRSHVLFYDVRNELGEQIPFAPRSEGLEVLVIDTQAKHSHSESGYGDRRSGTARAAELLGVRALRDVSTADLAARLSDLPQELHGLARHVVTENDRVLRTVGQLHTGRYAEIGPLLTESHRSLRDDYRVSCDELDLAVDSSLEAGSLGARMIGGGFGGSAIALVATEQRDKVDERVNAAFADRRLPAPRLFTALPEAGAGRDR